MSFVLALAETDGIHVLADSAGFYSDGAAAQGIAMKCHVKPAIGIAVASAGIAGVLKGWLDEIDRIAYQGTAGGIDDLAALAEHRLPNIDAAFEQKIGGYENLGDIAQHGPVPGATTILHFGWSDANECWVIDAFSREEGFVCSRFGPSPAAAFYGLVPLEGEDRDRLEAEQPSTYADMLALASELLDKYPDLVGGPVWLTTLTDDERGGTKFTVEEI